MTHFQRVATVFGTAGRRAIREQLRQQRMMQKTIDASKLLFAAALVFPLTLVAQALTYPPAQRDEVVDDYHGTRIADPYRWLEQVDSRRTGDWLKAQKRLTSAHLARIPNRAAIHRRLMSLRNYARAEVPWREAGRLFYLRNAGLQPQSVLYMQINPNSPPRLVLDPNAISADGSIAVRDYAVSPDGRFVAYNTSRGGSDEAETRIRQLSSGRDLNDVVGGVMNSVCWTQAGGGFFYVRRTHMPEGSQGDSQAGKQVWYHVTGQTQRHDRLVLDLNKAARWAYCMLSEDGRYALMVAEAGTENEIYAVNLGEPRRPDVLRPPIKLLPDREGFHTPIDIVGDTLYLRTTFEAPKERVIALDLRVGVNANPRPIVPEAGDVIESAAIAGDRIALHYLVDVKSRLRLFTLDGQPAGEVPLPEIGAVSWPLNGRPSTAELFYSLESFLKPGTVYRYDLNKKEITPFHPPQVPFDVGAYETKQIFYPSKDGTRVPMFVTAAKHLKLDGTHPTLLTAYGGYGSSLTPGYQWDIPMWLEMGGIYAVANIRGGGEYGDAWHRAGMLENKQNSFDDFIAAAEYLSSARYTAADKLAIYGYSNGGLLIGAVITQRPDLFAVALPNAGHHDMLRYHRFTAGAGWVSEYGSPDDPADFRYLRAYSPLHNVRSTTCYPSTMLLAADHDDRVVPSHSYKFAAALQAAQRCNRPVLLRVAGNSSHTYASRRAQVDEKTDMWTFVVGRLNIRRP